MYTSMDPCPGTEKYWFVTYTCYSGETNLHASLIGGAV